MKTPLKLLISASVILASVCLARAASRADSLLSVLKQTVAQRDVYKNSKEAEIKRLRTNYEKAPGGEKKFFALGDLLDAYTYYNTDSCFSILRRKEEMARKIGNPDLIVNARLNRANLLGQNAMFTDALAILDSIPPANVPEYLRPFYFYIKRTLYGNLTLLSVEEETRDKYRRLTQQARDSLMAIKAAGSFEHDLIQADSYNYAGSPDKAIALLLPYFNSGKLRERDRASCAYTLSESYRRAGNKEHEKEMLLTAAISDMKLASREYAALHKLAVMLYEEGNLDDAYEFLRICIDDAVAGNARMRQLELNETFPIVNSVYLDTVHRQSTHQIWMIVAVSMLLLFVIAGCWLLYRQNKRLDATKSQLQQAYTDIREASAVKDAYLGRYMDLCILYIAKIDGYRRHLRKILKSGKIDELEAELKSNTLITEDLKKFYANFDAAFLAIFPDFVDRFNELLRPEERIYPKGKEELTPELRIFALIRLGINESSRISQFLHYSSSTIYNYRTRVRNKAINSRDTLEEDIMKIGSGHATAFIDENPPEA